MVHLAWSELVTAATYVLTRPHPVEPRVGIFYVPPFALLDDPSERVYNVQVPFHCPQGRQGGKEDHGQGGSILTGI